MENEKRPLISSEMLDDTLRYFVENCPQNKLTTSLPLKNLKEVLGDIDHDVIQSVVYCLRDDGFLEDCTLSAYGFSFILHNSALRHMRLGGYTAREELMDKQLKLLEAQINGLDKKTASKLLPFFNALLQSINTIFKVSDQVR